MVAVVLNENLRDEYEHLFKSCVIHADRIALCDAIVLAIGTHKAIYEQVSVKTKVPWFVIGCIHHMECNLNFNEHLHNGDPLTARTTHVPKGRPINGEPPFDWQTSAVDALKLRHLDLVKKWDIAQILWELEGYNGYGYRQYHPKIKSPYLWSFTNQYWKGKYVSDGKFDPDCVSQQLGIAAILKRAEFREVYKPLDNASTTATLK